MNKSTKNCPNDNIMPLCVLQEMPGTLSLEGKTDSLTGRTNLWEFIVIVIDFLL